MDRNWSEARKRRPNIKMAIYNRVSGKWESIIYQIRKSEDLLHVLREDKVTENSNKDNLTNFRPRVVVRTNRDREE
ncbi:hypothetical protein MEO39_26930, partial [Dolichospermum sp. ST_sed2]|nr:hypothetical protein [Dolichospermum sp. ST_sed2]